MIEVTAAGTLYWRLRKESSGEVPPASVERRELRIVGVGLFVLAAYVAYEATSSLIQKEGPESSFVAMGMAAAALIAMPFLAVAKRRTGRALDSEALVADSRETIASAYLAFTVLAGLGLDATLSWCWADSVAALAMLPYLGWAGISAWRDSTEQG